MKNVETLRERLISPQQFADRLSISRWTIYSWLSEGRIEFVKLGRLVRIPERELDRIIREGSREAVIPEVQKKRGVLR